MTGTPHSEVDGIAPELAARHTWDVAVIGAGPGGAMAARELARRCEQVLLLDKQVFPRAKVCGCCLGGAAVRVLEAVGLGELPARTGAPRLREFCVAAARQAARLPLFGGYAVSRARLDHALVGEAVRTGARWLSAARATVSPRSGAVRTLHVSHAQGQFTVAARAVVVADGLAGTALAELPEFASRVTPGSHIGVCAIVESHRVGPPAGTIWMGCAAGGYVGLVRLEDGRLNVAGALAPGFLRDAGGPGPAVRRIFQSAGLDLPPALAGVRWRGTPELTRRRPTLARDRVFVVGDAASYVEPFTGEGMAWALAGGAAVADLAARAARQWQPELDVEWAHRHRAACAGRQQRCRWIAAALRRPALTAALITVLARMPLLARPYTRSLSRAPLLPIAAASAAG